MLFGAGRPIVPAPLRCPRPRRPSFPCSPRIGMSVTLPWWSRSNGSS